MLFQNKLFSTTHVGSKFSLVFVQHLTVSWQVNQCLDRHPSVNQMCNTMQGLFLLVSVKTRFYEGCSIDASNKLDHLLCSSTPVGTSSAPVKRIVQLLGLQLVRTLRRGWMITLTKVHNMKSNGVMVCLISWGRPLNHAWGYEGSWLCVGGVNTCLKKEKKEIFALF